ncbi:MAG: IS1634 family transposase [Bacteroidota bacterium]|nr:IS1634 family transposase [Bacteroidota bacterium]
MFIKKVTNNKKGMVYLTYRLVKSQRVNGIPKHINIIELGSLPEIPLDKHKALADRIEQLMFEETLLFSNQDVLVEEWAHFYYKKLIKNSFNKPQPVGNTITNKYVGELFADNIYSVPQVDNIQQVKLDTFESISSHEIGGEWLCTQAIKELGLDHYLGEQPDWNLNETSVGMLGLLGRLLYPDSEKKTAEWLNENSAAMELYCPESGTVDRNRLMQCTKKLYQDKDKIEKHLSGQIESIYKIENKLILYDLTNTHFEGMMKQCPKAKYGHNKQKRNDCRQITLGLMADQDGFVKHSNYYAGNISEPKTFTDVLSELKPFKNGLHRPVIVMDAGIATEDNLKMSLGEQIDYLCVSRSGHKDLLAKVDKDKLVCFVNKNGQEVRTQFFYQNIEYQIGEEKFTCQETLLYVETPAKEAKERGMFGKKQQGFETGLEQIKQSVAKPQKNKKNQSIEKIWERIGRLKEKYSGIGQAYTIDVVQLDGQATDIEWQFIENNSIEPQLGTYFVRTSISAEDEALLWKVYRTVGEIESIFRTLKSDLNFRPVFHQKEINIESHLNLSVLAYFIVSFIRYRLKQNNIHHSWTEIVRIMNTQKCNLNSVINTKGEKILLKTCTRPQMKANEIYQAMKYKPMPFHRKITTLNVG